VFASEFSEVAKPEKFLEDVSVTFVEEGPIHLITFSKVCVPGDKLLLDKRSLGGFLGRRGKAAAADPKGVIYLADMFLERPRAFHVLYCLLEAFFRDTDHRSPLLGGRERLE
ncbi:MAG: hypothetical protein KAI47_01875, partial [Deltaproteobacteria bacterium]|nr:hypothetical protein [Deltaproteobacteria bacterium]